jgi:hypothetical protein
LFARTVIDAGRLGARLKGCCEERPPESSGKAGRSQVNWECADRESGYEFLGGWKNSARRTPVRSARSMAPHPIIQELLRSF